MDSKERKDFRNIQEDMEMGEDWSILDEDLMLTGGNNYLQRDESSKVVEKIRSRMKYKH
jgi:hypothetical protein